MPQGKTLQVLIISPPVNGKLLIFPIFFENLFPQQKVVGGGGRDETMRSLLPLKPKENFS